MVMALAGQMDAHLPQPTQVSPVSMGRGESAAWAMRPKASPALPGSTERKRVLPRGGSTKSARRNAAGSPPVTVNSGTLPSARAASRVGTAVQPRTWEQTSSRAKGSSLPSRSPSCRGFPDVGPFPSMATTASTRWSRGRKKHERSVSILAKSAALGKRKWYSGFMAPGMAPKRFFTAAVMPIMPWVLSLQKLMMASQSVSHLV